MPEIGTVDPETGEVYTETGWRTEEQAEAMGVEVVLPETVAPVVETEAGLHDPSEIVHTASGDITWAEYIPLIEKYGEGRVPSEEMEKIITARTEPLVIPPASGTPGHPEFEEQAKIYAADITLVPPTLALSNRAQEIRLGTTPPGAIPKLTPIPQHDLAYYEGLTIDPYDVVQRMAQEGATAAMLSKYAQVHPDAYRGAGATSVLDMVYSQYNTAQNLKGREQFDAYQILGSVPEGAEFVPGENGEWGYYTAEQAVERAAQSQAITVLGDFYNKDTGMVDIVGAASAKIPYSVLATLKVDISKDDYNALQAEGEIDLTRYEMLPDKKYMEKDYLANLQTSDPALYEIAITEGYDAYQIAFDAEYTKLGDGNNYLRTTDLNKIQESNPALYEIAMTEGYDAYRKVVNTLDIEYHKQVQAQRDTSNMLNEYRTPLPDVQTDGKRWVTSDGKTVQYVRNDDGSWSQAEIVEPLIPSGYQYNLIGALRNKAVDRDKLVEFFGEQNVKDSERMIADIDLVSSYPSLKIAMATGSSEVKEAVLRLFPEESKGMWKPPQEYTVAQIEAGKDTPGLTTILGETMDAAKRVGLYNPQKGDKDWQFWDRLSSDDKEKVAAETRSNLSSAMILAYQVTGWSPTVGEKIFNYFQNQKPDDAPKQTNEYFTALGNAWDEIIGTIKLSPLTQAERPFVTAIKEGFEFWYKGLGIAVDKGIPKLIESQEAVQRWANESSGAMLFGKNMASGIYDIASSMSMVIPLSVMGMGIKATSGRVPEAFAEAGAMGVGLLTWPASIPIKIAEEPVGGIGYAVGTIATLFVGPKTIAKVLEEARGIVPRFVPHEVLAFQVDITRVRAMGDLNPFRAQNLIEATQLVRQGTKSEVPLYDSLGRNLGKVAKKGHDAVIMDIEGKAVVYVTALERYVPDILYSAIDNVKSVALQTQKGGITVEPQPTTNVLWTSQNLASTFGKEGVLAIRTSEAGLEIKSLEGVKDPASGKYILDLPPTRRRSAFEALAKAGDLEPGIYPVIKGYGGVRDPVTGMVTEATLEDEWAVVGKLSSVEPTKYAPSTVKIGDEKVDTGTAVMITKDPTTGQDVPILWVATEQATKEGKGVISLAEKYKAVAYQTFVQPFRELGHLGVRPIKAGFEEPSGVSPLYSKFHSVEVKVIESGLKDFAKSSTNIPPSGMLDIVAREKSGARVIDAIKDDRTPAIRTASKVLGETHNIPKNVVPDLLEWAKDNKALGSGNIAERLTIPNADIPYSADFAVRDVDKAEKQLDTIYSQSGLKKGIDYAVTSKKPQIDVTGVTETNGRLSGDVYNKQGLITETQGVYINPDIGGKVRRRVSVVVLNKEGLPLAVTDKLEPEGYYGLPGGGFVEQGGVSSPTGGAWSQMRDELGLDIENIRQLPAYLGQINRHSLPGSYIILSDVKDPTLDLNWFARNFPNDPLVKRGITEIKDAKFWDGKSLFEVSPSTYDVWTKLINEGLMKGDATKLRISSKTPAKLLTARDTNYYRPKDLSVGGVDIGKKIPSELGFRVKVKDAKGDWVTSLDITDRAEHDKILPYGVELTKTGLVDGIEFETLGNQLARRGVAIMRSGIIDELPIIKRYKDIPKFQLGVEYLLDKVAKTPEERVALKYDLDNFLGDYATRLQQAVNQNPKVGQVINQALGQKAQQIRIQALKSAVQKVPSTSGVPAIVKGQALVGKIASDYREVLPEGAEPDMASLESRLETDEVFREAYEEEFAKESAEPIRITLDRFLMGEAPEELIEPTEELYIPEKPIAPIEPTEVIAPIEPAEVITPIEPAEAIAPIEPAEAITPIEPAEAITPIEPAEAITPIEPTEVIPPIEPTEVIPPIEPTEVIPPIEPTEVIPPIEPTEVIPPIELPRILVSGKGQIEEDKLGRIAYAMGSLRQERGELKTQWWVIDEPYKQGNVTHLSLSEGEVPEGATIVYDFDSAKETIQTITGAPPADLHIDVGIMDINIQSPGKQPGKQGAVTFSRDIEQRTTGDITIGRKPRRIAKKKPKLHRRKEMAVPRLTGSRGSSSNKLGTIKGWFG